MLLACLNVSFIFNFMLKNVFLVYNLHNFDFFVLAMYVVEIRMKSAAAGKTRFFDPPRMIFAA
jgi:hypothetical protein